MDMFISDSDYESNSEATDSEDQGDGESSYGGHAQSILSSLDASIGKIDDFLAFERGFVHGDIVCSNRDASGQLGRIVDIDMIIDLETVNGKFIKDVNSKKLLKVRAFASGDHVVHGPWLGRVEKIFDVVTVLFSDGAKCEIMTGSAEILIPLSPNLYEDMPYSFHPGQHVRIELPTISKSARWLCGSWKRNRDEGVVCNVEVGLVHVNWIASVLVDSDAITRTPPNLQKPNALTLLSCFPYANWQLGDWCTLPHDHFNDMQMPLEKATQCAGPQYLPQMWNNLGLNSQSCKQLFLITRTRTKVDVLWQNGERSFGLDPQTLYPVNNIGDHDFWPEQFVLQRGTLEDAQVSTGQRLGVVKYVDAQERTVKVKWMVPECSQPENITAEHNEETVSAYELIEHPDFSYCIGDVVFRVSPKLEKLVNDLLDQPKDSERQLHPLPVDTKVSNSLPPMANFNEMKDGEDHNFDVTAYLSCIGSVTDFKDERIEVRWASGLTSKVQPCEIYGLDRLENPPQMLAVNEEAPSEVPNKQTVEQEKFSWGKKEKVAGGSSNHCKMDVWDAGSLSLPRAAIGFFTNIAKSLFGSHGSSSLSGTWHELSTEELHPGVGDPPFENLTDQAEVDNQKDEMPVLQRSGKALRFEQFDIVDDYSDHHFVNGIAKELVLSQVKSSWLKKVHQEWNILEKNLPDSIYVRVSEERIDLLRTAIVGAPGTPYCDGLFFFDIFLPPDYPHEPPLVHYNSGGLRLNPNLYESGKVCLSLLKTWMGTGTEVWSPETSTILQLLLSLQALVLNDKPYFNEAGYDKQIGKAEGEKNSVTYNENAFLLSLKSMLYILRNPPKHFESLVEDHFARRSRSILSTCKVYMEGGQAFECETTVDDGRRSCSTGFKIMLEKLFPKLISGFAEKGIDCGYFMNQIDGNL